MIGSATKQKLYILRLSVFIPCGNKRIRITGFRSSFCQSIIFVLFLKTRIRKCHLPLESSRRLRRVTEWFFFLSQKPLSVNVAVCFCFARIDTLKVVISDRTGVYPLIYRVWIVGYDLSSPNRKRVEEKKSRAYITFPSGRAARVIRYSDRKTGRVGLLGGTSTASCHTVYRRTR